MIFSKYLPNLLKCITKYDIYIIYTAKIFCGRIGIKRVRKFGKIKYYLVSKTLRLKGSPLQVSYNTVRKPVANKFNVNKVLRGLGRRWILQTLFYYIHNYTSLNVQ